MPVLSLATEPPSRDYSELQSPGQEVDVESISDSKLVASVSHEAEAEAQSAPKAVGHITTSSSDKIPIVSLDVDHLTDIMAAKLAVSMLGHVLFLKSQIPLPIIQLYKMQSSKSTARAAKLRSELLSSFDTLASHLNTTFTALSTALARSKSKTSGSETSTEAQIATGQAFLAILVGSSLTSAKSKVIYAVDGLEAKIWGTRDDVPPKSVEVNEEEEANKPDEEEVGGEQEESDEDANTPEESEEEESDSEPEDEEEESDSGSYASSEEATSPPPSRSPSPGPPPTYAEEQKRLESADRLFSRTLALADAEGNGMSADMAPTQTHVVLRAPRRFSHPAWVPRQNISASLENTLEAFLIETGLRKGEAEGHIGKRKGQAVVEGAWVTARDGLRVPQRSELLPQADEWDEMIWWSWDGKLVGFSEW